MKSFSQFQTERNQKQTMSESIDSADDVAETIDDAIESLQKQGITSGKAQLRMLSTAVSEHDYQTSQELVDELSPTSVRAIKIAALDNDTEVDVASVLGISAE